MLFDVLTPDHCVANRRRARIHYFLAATLCALPLTFVTPAHAGVLDHVTAFRIKPEGFRRALLAFGRQAHLQIIIRGAKHPVREAPGLSGRYTAREAIARLLSGTHLTYSVTDRTVEIYPMAGREAQLEASDRSRTVAKNEGPFGRSSSPSSRSVQTPPVLQQVIVTGSHISGAPPPSEPIISITARQIRESGYQSVEQLMAALPENLHSIGSEVNNLPSQNDAGNQADGSGVDLLGMGYDSTLVLVNGHRLAPAGINGAFTDISVIPLSMIKRIDVVTDGASAIYGSDAMGGVVNYILKDRQEGGATSLEYGSVTHGSLNDYRVSQSYGLNWDSGHALIAYEYHDETPLNATDRAYSFNSVPGQLTPSMTTNSVYLTGNESLGRGVSLNGAVFYSHRRDSTLVTAGITLGAYVGVTQYSYSIGADASLPDHWTLRAHGAYGGNNSHTTSTEGLIAGDNVLSTGSLVGSGPMFQMPGGPAKAAIGVQYRRNALSAYFTGLYDEQDIHRSREVDSAFVEGEIPLIGARNEGLHGQKLNVDIAARLDHYSDFGSTTNPRIGIAWRPEQGIKFRGTLSRSFKAPNFYELNGGIYTYLVNSPEATLPTGQSTAALVRVGANPGLTAERSTEWTVGVDLRPRVVEGLQAHVTYYDARFTHKIENTVIPLLDALGNEELYSLYIQQNPSLLELEQYVNTSNSYINLTVYPGYGPPRMLSDATAIVDDRFQNVGTSWTKGLLASLGYTHEIDGYQFDAGFSGAYIFAFDNRIVSGSPSFSTLGIFGRPVNFRGRLSVGIHHEDWGVSAFTNYVNRYEDTSEQTPIPIASWTTVDFTASYRLFNGENRWGRSEIGLSCINCADRAPPEVSQLTSSMLGYDGANANPLGRFISATVSIRW